MTALSAPVTWLLTAPLAVFSARSINADPFTDRAAVMSMALAMLMAIAVAVVALVARRWRRVEGVPLRPALSGITAGLLSSWTAFTTAGALVGTPYGYGGLQGDVVRLTAMATRYMTSWGSTDQFVGNLPAEYPPLFPWLTGHLAALTGRQAWALVGDMEVLTMSLGLVFAYALWSRVVPAVPALLITALGIAEFADPRKSYEVVALWLFVPWVLSYLTPRALQRRHSWLSGGVIAGLLILLYQGYFLFALPGLAVLVVLPLWRADRTTRRRWALHVLATGLVAFVVASWFLVPYLWTSLTSGSQRTYDYFVSPGGLRGDPLGTSVLTDGGWLAVVHGVGLLGLALLWRRSRWARTLAVLFLGTLLYRTAYLGIFVLTGHTGLLHYATRLLAHLLTVASVLTAAAALSRVRARYEGHFPNGAVPAAASFVTLRTVGVAALIGLSLAAAWHRWWPVVTGPVDCGRDFAICAHLEPLPDGSAPRFHPAGVPLLSGAPVNAVRDAVTSVLGEGARPHVVVTSERYLAFLPWPAYTGVVRGAANSLERWDDRNDELDRIAALNGPAATAAALATTPLGPIDVLVLQQRGGNWVTGGRATRFAPTDFAGPQFVVRQGLPDKTVVVVRVGQ